MTSEAYRDMELRDHRRQVELMEPAYRLLTVEEFLGACPHDKRHYQLFDGVMVAMAPPATPHQVIAPRLGGEIYVSLNATRPECVLRAQARIAPQGLQGRDHFETDLTVSCSPLDRDDRGIVSDPVLIVEVLSPSTDRDDIFINLPAYQRVPSLQEMLYRRDRAGRRDGVPPQRCRLADHRAGGSQCAAAARYGRGRHRTGKPLPRHSGAVALIAQ